MHTHTITGAGFCARLAALAALVLITLTLAPESKATPITVIASFNVTNGQQPMCGVTFDAAGNMYGTTYRGDSTIGSTNPGGVVWEIPHGTNTITDLARFVAYGSEPGDLYGNVVVDANGNVYGTASSGGTTNSSVYGEVFEVAAGSNTVSDLGDFEVGANPGQHPVAGVTRDAAGDLFGTTQYGSTNNAGTIWEIPAGGTLTTIASFLGTGGSGSVPLDGVTLDSQGNLYGTCSQSGVSEFGGYGAVWELPRGSSTVVTLADFNNTNGYSPSGDVAVDAAGNVYGTATGGGVNNAGVVWEIVAGTNTITDLASFAGSIGADTVNGYTPSGNVVIDGAGNLFGTTTGGGTSDSGTVWEIPAGGALTTIASFTGANGQSPYGDVSLDAQGNLFGTTSAGGPANAGVVWEMVGVGVGGGSAVPTGLTLTPNPAHADTTINGTVTFSRSVPAGTAVAFTRNGTSLGSVATPTAGTSLAITLPLPGYLNGSYTIGATLNGQTATQTLTVTSDPAKPVPTSLVFSPNPVAPNTATTGTLTLSAPVPTGGVSVEFFVNGTDVGPVTIPAGASTGTFSETLAAGTYTFAAVENGVQVTSTLNVSSSTSSNSASALLWTNTSGQVSLWSVGGSGAYTNVVYGPFSGWTARALAGGPDGSNWILWTTAGGQVSLWNVTAFTATGYTHREYGPYAGYSAVSLSVDTDGSPRILWDKTDGTALLWKVNASSGAFTYAAYGPYSGWTANQVASGYSVTDLLWTNTNGAAAGWRIASNGTYVVHAFGPYSGYHAVSLSVGTDDAAHLLWDATNGAALLWNVDFSSGAFTYTSYGPFSGYTARGIGTGADNVTHMLWDTTSGSCSLWALNADNTYSYNLYGPFSGWNATAVCGGP